MENDKEISSGFSLFLTMTIEIVDSPIDNGDFPQLCEITRGYGYFVPYPLDNLSPDPPRALARAGPGRNGIGQWGIVPRARWV